MASRELAGGTSGAWGSADTAGCLQGVQLCHDAGRPRGSPLHHALQVVAVPAAAGEGGGVLRRKGTHSHRLAGTPQRRRAPSRTQAEKCARCPRAARTHPHLVGTPGSSSENSSRQMLHAGRQGRAVCSADDARLASSTPPVARGQRLGHWRAIRPLAAQVEGYDRGTPLCGEAIKGAYLQISC